MRSTIENLDELLIRVATRVSHAAQRAIGWTNYRLAALSAHAFASNLALDLGDYWWPDLLRADRTSLLVVVLGGVLFPAVLRYAVVCERAHQKFTSSTLSPEALQLRSTNDSAVFRVVYTSMALTVAPAVLMKFVTAGWLDAWAFTGLLWIALLNYFVIVIPLPPSESRVGSFVRELRAGVAALRPQGSGA